MIFVTLMSGCSDSEKTQSLYDLQSDIIPWYLKQVDVERLTTVANDLVTLFGPRHHKHYRIYIDDKCTTGDEVFPKNNLDMTSDYVMWLFDIMGYTSELEEVILSDGTPAYNVIATKIGSIDPNTFIEVGAHIDTVSSTPGAGDNASGVTAMVELARVLVDYPNRHSIRFIAHVGEESYQTGSNQHLDGVLARREEIKAGLIIDGVGWSEIAPDHMNCIWDNGDAETLRIAYLFDFVRTRYNIDIAWRLCYPSGNAADNVAYWQRGFPAVLSVGGFPYQAPGYHGCGDTMDVVDMQNIYKTTQENLAVILTLDAEARHCEVWRQTDWSGGDGQSTWIDDNRYSEAEGINDSIPGQITLENISGGDILLYDNFYRDSDEENPLLPWYAHTGEWEVSDGVVKSLTPPFGYSLIYYEAPWSDYLVEGRFQLPIHGYVACINGRLNTNNGSQYCACVYGGNVLRLINLDNWTNWSWDLIKIVELPYVGTDWHTLGMDFYGNRVRVFFDGDLLIDVPDGNYSSGGISLLTYTSSDHTANFGGAFDDIQVRSHGEFNPSGTLLSSAFDGGPDIDWAWITMNKTSCENADVFVRTRTADDFEVLYSAPWSEFITSGSAITSPDKRWIQYELSLYSNDPSITPTLYDITFWSEE